SVVVSVISTSDDSVLEIESSAMAPPVAPLIGVAGSPGTRLLAGPAQSLGTETLAGHDHRLGIVDLDDVAPQALRDTVRARGLLGRGGAGFPTATKLDLAAASTGTPIVVVNAS